MDELTVKILDADPAFRFLYGPSEMFMTRISDGEFSVVFQAGPDTLKDPEALVRYFRLEKARASLKVPPELLGWYPESGYAELRHAGREIAVSVPPDKCLHGLTVVVCSDGAAYVYDEDSESWRFTRVALSPEEQASMAESETRRVLAVPRNGVPRIPKRE